MRKFYIMMEEFDKAMAYQTAEKILEHKRALRNVVKSRKGRKIKPLRYLTSQARRWRCKRASRRAGSPAAQAGAASGPAGARWYWRGGAGSPAAQAEDLYV